jgi:hypothetical protein
MTKDRRNYLPGFTAAVVLEQVRVTPYVGRTAKALAGEVIPSGFCDWESCHRRCNKMCDPEFGGVAHCINGKCACYCI